MAPIPNPRVVYAAIPDGLPIPGKHTIYDDKPTIDLDNVPLNGGFLTKTLILSPEPFMRARMRDKSVPGYSTTFIIDTPIVGFGLVEVIRSEDEKYIVKDRMYGMTTWEAYTVQPYIDARVKFDPKEWPAWTFDMDSLGLRVVQNPSGIPWPTFVGAIGTPGLTAFVGLEGYGNAKAGETLYVSAAAGAVGSMVAQLAKLKGLKVIGSASSDEKVKWLTEVIGVDHAFNYKKVKPMKALEQYGPIDIYWDNVGGEFLEAAIAHSAYKGRIIICGQISEYNGAEPYGIKNTIEIFQRRLTVHGLLVPDLVPQFVQRFFTEIPALVAQGKIKTNDYIVKGLENADKALVEMFEGKNTGKTVVVVADVVD